MKKLGILILSLIACISLSACSSKPDPTVTNFCNAMQQFDFEAMNEYIADGEEESIEEIFDDTEGENILSILKECAAKMTYEIESSEVTDNTAKVSVKFNYADLSPVIRDTLSEYMQQALALAFSGADEAAFETLFEDIFNEKYNAAEITMTDASVEFECENTDNGWKITNVSNDVVNVLTANMLSGLEELLGETGGSDSESTNEDKIVHDVELGETIELATIKLCVTGCEERTTLSSGFGETTAPEGTKFVVFSAEIENITKEPLSFNNDLKFYDNQGRQYEPYNDSYLYLDGVFSYVDLAPNIKQTGYLVYNVPQDAAGYYIVTGKSGTNDVYHFYGNK